jgi:hypothetical protein
MAKTKVVTIEGQTEPASQEAPVAPTPKKVSSKKQVINGTATVNVSYNNTLISIGDSSGQIIAWSSAGLLGLRVVKNRHLMPRIWWPRIVLKNQKNII